MKDPHNIIVQPHITERSATLSYGDPRKSDEENTRKYTFIVARDANKIEIKKAIESIYNAGKKKGEGISVAKVHTIRVLGKKRRRTQKSAGYEPDRKKAIITLVKGQMLEDFGV